MAVRWIHVVPAILFVFQACAARRTNDKMNEALLSEVQEDDIRSVHNGSDASGTWPRKKPWNQLDPRSRRVLGEGSFGLVLKYSATCGTGDAVGVKEVKQEAYAPMREKMANCIEATKETKIQMIMAEKDRAVRIFDLNPKNCHRENLTTYPKMNIMMALARGDGVPTSHRRQAPSISLMLDIAKQLMYGLRELHSKGYLHRDIKPANLLVEGADPFTKWENCAPGACRFTLSDFGLACQKSRGVNTCVEDSCGTPIFMPPEICKSALTGDRTKYHYGRGMDFWALGVTLYQMWTAQYPGALGSAFRSIKALLQQISALGDFRLMSMGADDTWWKQTRIAERLELQAGRSPPHRLFSDLLSALLKPDRSRRESSVDAEFDRILDQVQTPDMVAAVPQVCVDPCANCPEFYECRAEGLHWVCKKPLEMPVKVGVTVVDASGSNRHEFVMKSGTAGSTLADLKILTAAYYNLDMTRTAFFFPNAIVGSRGFELDDSEILGEGEELVMSIHLRNALIHGPAVGDALLKAITSATRAKNIEIPFLVVARKIHAAWPSDRWRAVSSALRSPTYKDTAKLADQLRPLVTEAQQFIEQPLTAWEKALAGLTKELETRMAEDLQKRFQQTADHCGRLDWGGPGVGGGCAKDVQMEMPEDVDYVKVSYTLPGESAVKIKFYQDGEILQTRGEDVMQKSDGPLRLELPTLPGSTELTVTLCKDLMQQEGTLVSIRNAMSSSRSRCEKMAEPIKYTLWSNGGTSSTQAAIDERKHWKFQISSAPEVSFLIWDGNWALSVPGGPGARK